MIAFDPDCVHKYGKLNKRSTIELDDWRYFYPDAVETHQRKNLEPLGETVTLLVYVDVNHSGKSTNMRSRSGILIYFNNTLIKFYRKRQNTV